ncbi:SRPBCC family protein [Rhodococcus koreensis]|uniref:SRPBCC family protein n=1 Tax=Rhodococcus koreensis TaxID=99653 RepID=UPI0036DDC529
MIDVTEQINAVRRSVGSRTLEAGEARIVTIGRTYDATVEEVWEACTDAERIPRWFMPVTGDLRLHGRYQLEGNAGGEILTCDPPNGFTATWEYGGDVSWIDVSVTADPGGGTRFELRHTAHVDDKFWDDYGPGATGVGWELGVLGLFLYLGPGESMDPKESEAWSASDEGKEFVTASSAKWRDASIAFGTPEVAATAAGDRTTAFYTGVESEAG